MIKIPVRKSIAMTTVISGGMLLVGLLFTNAHNSPLDELGCHRDPPNSKYHCHTGPLKGREFTSKEEAQRAVASVNATGTEPESEFAVRVEDSPQAKAKAQESESLEKLPPAPQQETAVVNAGMLKIITWNVKKMGAKLDFDRIVNLMSEADVAILHGIDLDEKGKGPLHISGDLLQQRIGEKVCRAWFRTSSGAKEHYGILWRNSTVGYVDKGGEIKDTCGEMAVIIPMTSKVASSLFFSKVQKKMFMLGTIQADQRPSKADRDVPALFKSLEGLNWPTIVTGDVHASTDFKKWPFKTALASSAASKKGRGSKSLTSNVWTRNAVVVRAIHINLYDRFSELSTKDIDNNLSESFPTLAEVALVPEPDDHIQTLIIKSKKDHTPAAKKESTKSNKVVTEARSKESFEDPKEDLEEEAGDADGGDRRGPASAKSTHKKKKKKKH